MKQLQQGLVDVNFANLKKLISQMSRDGYIEIAPRVRRKGMNSDTEHSMCLFSYFPEHGFPSTRFCFMFSLTLFSLLLNLTLMIYFWVWFHLYLAGRQVFHNPEADKKLQSLRAFFDSEMRDKEETEVRSFHIGFLIS